ncbi:MAG: signal peptidase I [Solobacterium sp.]|nr:signal peptidase I [Solobacterium sp.]
MKRNTYAKEPETFLESVWDFIKTLMISMVIVFLVANFVARPIQVRGDSMYPTLESSSIGISNVLGRKMSGLKRFDIAIIYLKDKDEYLVKRVVGLPGETISYHGGTLYVNGEAVEEPFLDTWYRTQWGEPFMEDVEEITLEEGEYYCLGDNRPSSRDSRYYGPFYEEQIVAKGSFILYPFDQFGVKSW